MTSRDELRKDLRDLSRQARALLEWYSATGASGLPRDRPSGPPRQARAPRLAAPAQPPREAHRPSPHDAERTPAPPPTPTPRPPSAEPTPPAQVHDAALQLRQLEAAVAGCKACPLHAQRKQTVFARGAPQAALVFVGEGPGAQEDAQGIPFVGPAGELLDRMIGAMGLDRDDVYICNIVKCRPPNNRKPTPEEMQACEPFLRQQLELVNPDVMVALGATAAQGLLGWYDVGPRGPGITRLRGQWKVYAGRTPLMPTFHPAYLLRSPEKKRDVWNDLQAVMERLGLPPPKAGRRRS